MGKSKKKKKSPEQVSTPQVKDNHVRKGKMRTNFVVKKKRIPLIIKSLGMGKNVEEMAIEFGVTERTLYTDLAEIRANRKGLFSDEVTQGIGDKQLNRLNYLVQISFDDLIKSRERYENMAEELEAVDITAKGGLTLRMDLHEAITNDYFKKQMMYRYNELGLTKACVQIGVYIKAETFLSVPDKIVVNISGEPMTPPEIEVPSLKLEREVEGRVIDDEEDDE